MHPNIEGANPLMRGVIPLKKELVLLKVDLVTTLYCTINQGIGPVAKEVES